MSICESIATFLAKHAFRTALAVMSLFGLACYVAMQLGILRLHLP